MLAFYHGNWTSEQIEVMHEAVNEALFSIMQLSGCVNSDYHLNCNKCYYKKPCREFFALKRYLDDIVENSVQN